jgi:hypothetical protein
MPSPLRDPKSLSEWVELDYFRRPRRLRRRRRLLIWLSVVAGIAALVLLLRPSSHSIHQAGPLSAAHAMFSNDCKQCHKDLLRPVERFIAADPALRTVSDESCIRCHDGPIHQPTQARQPACASCHREHRGRIKLARLSDFHCTSCHADLSANMKAGTNPGVAGTVTAFSTDHPEFALWKDTPLRDPGTIGFNHAVHLQTDLPGAGGKRVTLDCNNCHQQDSERRYMKPVKYDAHCKDCHPLPVQVAAVTNPNLDEALRAFSKEPAPHKEPRVVRAVLRDRFERFVREHKSVLSPMPEGEPDRVIPGRPPAEPPPKEPGRWVGVQMEQAERLLFDLGGGCRFCHKAVAPRAPGALPEYAKSDIPERWYRKSFFRHESHQMLDCKECHGDIAGSRTARDVLMPKIGVCQQCHNPQVGARSDCGECHSYHDRSRDRGPGKVLTIDEATGRHGAKK